ncbi:MULTISPECIES: PAS domain-containing sensor histidine kinase [unclassified Clostridium]|uniref:PAS domain-containing sensor histidine kinase n=1 Tax=unclassified Clostridium TaxID=2614128 RepID=UPI000298559B|nr:MULTISPECIES: PAS domain-containing sensor histidine kinase [unclassified Clostridium]EKQ57629.1 MAG: PAS domain S-box [Clostridium sp. Maddingley MBC34-26]
MKIINNFDDKIRFIDNTNIYHALINSIAQAIWETDANGLVINDSPSWRAYTGQTYEEWVDQGWLNAVHPNDRGYAEIQWREAIMTSKNLNIESRIRSFNGEWKWNNIIASPILNSDGNIQKWVGINMDISQHKKKKDDLNGFYGLYQKIVEATDEGIVMIDEHGRINFVNEALIKILGYKAEEILSRDAVDFIFEDDIKKVMSYLKNAQNVIDERYDLKIRKKDGSHIWALIGAITIKNESDNYRGSLVMLIDITNKKNYEQELKVNVEEYFQIIDSSSEGSFIHDLERNESYFSNQWKKRLGIEHLSPREAATAIIEKSHPNDRSAIHKAYSKALKQKLPKVSMEFRAKTVDSGYIWVLEQAKIIYNEEGKPVKYLGTHMDINNRKKVEKNLKETLEVQDQVFANISHELRTPLNVIFSTNQLLEMYLKNDTFLDNKDKIIKGLSTIKQNCYRFTKIINNIVDLSKIESGFFKLNMSNENIVLIIEDIVESVASYIEQSSLSIIFDTNVEEKIIACDAYKIERVMLNLISNAIKFTNPGGKIFVNLTDKGNHVEISVKDTGIGMEKKYLKSIFKRYHQIDKTLSRNAEGSGIGLNLVKSIVKLHGGKISADSKVDEGTSFNISLPARLMKKTNSNGFVKPTNNKIEMMNIEFSDIYSI